MDLQKYYKEYKKGSTDFFYMIVIFIYLICNHIFEKKREKFLKP